MASATKPAPLLEMYRMAPQGTNAGTTSRLADLNFRLENWITRNGHWAVAATILCFFAFHSLFIYPRHVWYDEITTFSVARTFSWASICEALRLTADAQPPTYHALQMPVLYLLGDDPRHLRWLSLLASSAAIGAVFVWLRRTTGAVAALAGSIALAGSKLSFYSIEARPYAMLLSTASLALACQGLAWRIVWLALGVSVHFYGVFVPMVFALTERTWRRRFAYALAYCPLAITMPNMHPTHLLRASDEFAPSLLNLLKTVPVLAGGSLYTLAVLFVIGSLWWLRLSPYERFQKAWFRGDLTSWSLVAIAPVCWLMGVWFTGIFCMRYAIVSLLGVAGLVAWLVHRLPYRAIVSAAFCVVCLTGSLLTQRLLTMEAWDARPTAQLIDQTIATLRQPVVMGELHFLELHHYVRRDHRPQFVRLTENRPSFTTEYAYEAIPGQYFRWSEMIGKYAGFTPIGLNDWIAKHRSFTAVAAREDDWVLRACRNRGAQISRLSGNAVYSLYSIHMPAPTNLSMRQALRTTAD